MHGGGTIGLSVQLMLDEDDPPKVAARSTHSSTEGRWLAVTITTGPQMHAITLGGRGVSLVALLRDALAQAIAADEAGATED